MEITNESAEKVFAQYWPCEYIWEGTQERRKLKLESISVLIGSKVGSAKLLLKPLSSITDEDAIEVANILCVGDSCRVTSRTDLHIDLYGFNNNIEPDNSISIWFDGEILPDSHFELDPLQLLSAYQFLQSRGYDLPHYLLGGKTLIEAGLAIDINALNK